jgi:hypothetical protein
MCAYESSQIVFMTCPMTFRAAAIGRRAILPDHAPKNNEAGPDNPAETSFFASGCSVPPGNKMNAGSDSR